MSFCYSKELHRVSHVAFPSHLHPLLLALHCHKEVGYAQKSSISLKKKSFHCGSGLEEILTQSLQRDLPHYHQNCCCWMARPSLASPHTITFYKIHFFFALLPFKQELHFATLDTALSRQIQDLNTKSTLLPSPPLLGCYQSLCR